MVLSGLNIMRHIGNLGLVQTSLFLDLPRLRVPNAFDCIRAHSELPVERGPGMGLGTGTPLSTFITSTVIILNIARFSINTKQSAAHKPDQLPPDT